jgi:hypothetical protein
VDAVLRFTRQRALSRRSKEVGGHDKVLLGRS